MGSELLLTSLGWLKNKKNSFIILSIVIFLLIIFLYLPLARTIRKKSLEWNTFKGQLNSAQINLQVIQKSGTNKKLIRQQEASGVLNAITQEGRNLRLNFKSLNQKEIRGIENKYAILPVEMEIEGGYEELGHFLGALEGLESSIVTIESFKIWRDDKILPKISASLVVKLYLVQD